MLKKYKTFNESLLNKITGPDEIKALKANPTSVLFDAYYSDNEVLFRKALEYGADIEKKYNTKNYTNAPLILFTIKSKNDNLTKLLIDFGANIKNDILLNILGEYGSYEIIKYILDKIILTYEQYQQISRFNRLRKNEKDKENIFYLINSYIMKNVNKDVSKPWKPYSGVHDNKFINNWTNKYKDSLNLEESLLDKIEGPNEEEFWNDLGFIRTFDNVDEFFDYLVDDAEPIDTVGGRRWYKDDKPICREDVFNNLFIINKKYYEIMLRVFFNDRNELELHFRELLKKYPLWKKYKWITYGDIY